MARKEMRTLAFSPAELLKKAPSSAALARHWDALVRISRAISSVPGLDALEQQLAEMIAGIVPAERCGVILIGASPDEITSLFGWSRSAPAPAGLPAVAGEPSPETSRAIIDRVLREGLAILHSNPPPGGVPAEPAAAVRAALAVPLEISGRVRGAIYVETTDAAAAARFDEPMLQLLVSVGSIAGLALEDARRVESLERENRRLQEEIGLAFDMVGESPRMREVYAFVAKVGPQDSTVLIRGETGTGKELLARALHQASARAPRPFIPINCAAMPETLIESELFGYEKGAFTGAVAAKKGRLEAADGGTVFFDEIAELAPPLQAKLLRLLQDGEIQRLGSTRPSRVNLRLIAATNQDLEEGVRRGSFRADLYYRLNVVSLALPPLRERRDDIPSLARHFLARYSQRCRRRVAAISPEALSYLTSYDWPGNVRELENAIERGIVLGSAETILPEDLPEAILEREAPLIPVANGAGPSAAAVGYHAAVREAKKRFILEALERAGGSYTQAARLLGLHPNYLHRLSRNLDLKTPFPSRSQS
jgi:two-component system, NtrC family, response regulator HydG